MIAPTPTPAWQPLFLQMLPDIQRHAQFALRHVPAEAQEEAVQEVIANAMVAFARLHELDKVELAYPAVLARFGVAQVHDGRRVGSRRNVNEVLSSYAQRKKGFTVSRLDRHDADGEWQEVLVEDRTSTPADVAASRIDFAGWLGTLGKRVASIAKRLARGETTGEVADQVGLTPARISQLRNELRDSWQAFQDCGPVTA